MQRPKCVLQSYLTNEPTNFYAYYHKSNLDSSPYAYSSRTFSDFCVTIFCASRDSSDNLSIECSRKCLLFLLSYFLLVDTFISSTIIGEYIMLSEFALAAVRIHGNKEMGMMRLSPLE